MAEPATRKRLVGAKMERARAVRSPKTIVLEQLRVGAVLEAAKQSGLLAEKSGRIGGRISATLVSRAKAVTGIASDSELIEFALANVALDDRFAEAFRTVKGKVDPDLKLGF
jgi:hypothetical protein